MTKHELYNSEYLEWMCQLVSDKFIKAINYSKLMNHLYRVEFMHCMPMDRNRAADGANLRYRYEYATGMTADPVLVAFYGDDKCSVLEMMVSLALRCEESIMSDIEFGDRTGLWFWNMIQSLGLQEMDDRAFDECFINEVLSKWMNRDFEPSGKGSLFTVPSSGLDMRDVEIWYQMNWYLKSIA